MGALFLELKLSEREAVNLPSSSVEVDNAGTLPPIPHTS
jgi:hypothetical protein